MYLKKGHYFSFPRFTLFVLGIPVVVMLGLGGAALPPDLWQVESRKERLPLEFETQQQHYLYHIVSFKNKIQKANKAKVII